MRPETVKRRRDVLKKLKAKVSEWLRRNIFN